MTIELKETFMDNSTDKWVFATNERGEILDVVQLQSGTPTVELKTTTPFATFNFTIFSFYDGPNHFSLETFKGFPENETIVLGTTPITPAAPAGNANITVTNYTESDATFDVKFSTKKFGTNGVTNPVISGSNYSADITLGTSSETVHVYGIRSGIPVYSMVSNVLPNVSRSVDFLSFTPFENVVQLPFIGYAYTVGIEDDKSQFELVATSKQASADPRQLYTATVPGFSKYLTYIVSFTGFEYWRIGAPITSFAPPVYSISISNNTIQNFQSAITGSHDYKSVDFAKQTGNESASWRVHADNNTDLNIDFDLPNELKLDYPTLTVDGLQYRISSFYRSSATYTYKDMLAYRFKNVVKDELELLTLTSQ
jgi:hypothetical protein